MKKSIWILMLPLMMLMTSGCAQQSRQKLPQEVAKQFWNAMIAGDMRTAKGLTIRGELEEPKVLGTRLTGVETAGAKVVQGRAFVPTTLHFKLPVKEVTDRECNTTMDTELLKVEGAWRIDDVVTMRNYEEAIKQGVAACSAKLLEESIEKGLSEYEKLQKSLNKSFKTYKKTFEETFKALQETMRKTLEDLQKELQEQEENATPAPLPQKGERI